MTQTLDPLLTTVNKSQTPAKKAKWHLGKLGYQEVTTALLESAEENMAVAMCS